MIQNSTEDESSSEYRSSCETKGPLVSHKFHEAHVVRRAVLAPIQRAFRHFKRSTAVTGGHLAANVPGNFKAAVQES